MNLIEDEEQAWVLNQLLEEDAEEAMQAIYRSWINLPASQASIGTRSRAANIDRERMAGHNRIYKDYFADEPVYTDAHFRRRFRMRRVLFLRIMDRLVAHDVTFQQRCDAIGQVGLSSIQKMTCALRMLAYGSAADQLDEYIRIGESTGLDCLSRFCKSIVYLFCDEYLRRPNVEDMQRILAFNQARGFPSMMGSIDCMHWAWKNCPKAWAGQFQGRKGKPTIVLEAVASYDLWIWHAFVGMPGSNNDINILDRSSVFQDQVDGVAPKAFFCVNGNLYTQTYLLADGIYPKWATFVQTIAEPQGEKRKYYAKMQEAARKDIERAFGVLQARWAIIREPGRTWSENNLQITMTACIILHNMIVEDEHGQGLQDELNPDLTDLRVVRGNQQRDRRLPSIFVNQLHLRDAQRMMSFGGI